MEHGLLREQVVTRPLVEQKTSDAFEPLVRDVERAAVDEDAAQLPVLCGVGE